MTLILTWAAHPARWTTDSPGRRYLGPRVDVPPAAGVWCPRRRGEAGVARRPARPRHPGGWACVFPGRACVVQRSGWGGQGMRFAHQAEYRLLWFTDGVVPPWLSVKAPAARPRSDAAASLMAAGLTVRAMSTEVRTGSCAAPPILSPTTSGRGPGPSSDRCTRSSLICRPRKGASSPGQRTSQ